ncbi:MAG: AAA family ATPase [bacterium]
MHLKQLAIQGFKSFATPVTLHFNRELTAVVGPNGSGKSNIADAIRWVLGEQSLKILRGKKSEDVIFAGSASKGKLGLAEVVLTLDNVDHEADVPYDEVVLTRRVYRNGESEYLVNGNKVRLQDVLLLLAQLRCGQKSYAVIGQGMVDAIVTASPAERKEFFDEATGVKQYQLKRDQAVHKLELTKENLAQSQTVLSELEPRLRSLTRQMDKLQARADLEKELGEARDRYYGSLWQELNKQLEQAVKETEVKRQEAMKLAEQVEEQQQQLDMAVGNSSRSDAYDQWQKETKQLSLERERLLGDKLVIESKRSGGAVAVDRDRTDNELKQRQTELEAVVKELHLLTADFRKKEAEQKQINEHYQKTESKLRQLRDEAFGRGFPSGRDNGRLKELAAGYRKFLDELKLAAVKEDWSLIKQLLWQGETLVNELSSVVSSGSWTAEQQQELERLQKEADSLLRQKEALAEVVSVLRSKVASGEERKHFLEHEVKVLGERSLRLTAEAKALEKGDTKALDKERQEQLKKIAKELTDLDKLMAELDQRAVEARQTDVGRQSGLQALQRTVSDGRERLGRTERELGILQIEQAKLETRKEDLERQIREKLDDGFFNKQLKILGEETLAEAKRDMEKLERQLETIGGIDPNVPAEYEEVKGRHGSLFVQVNDLVSAMAGLEKLVTDLDQVIEKQFQIGFARINKAFGEYFRILFNGGQAKIILEQKEVIGEKEETDEEEIVFVKTGIDIHALPPGKKLQGLSALSGGEKALTSIALICAIIANQPSPFVVLDEVDAALDEANSERFAQILHTLQEKSQVIAITHNRATMHQAAVLYGVTMGEDGVSRLLSIALKEAEQYKR